MQPDQPGSPVKTGKLMCVPCAVPTIFITLIYFMAHLRYTAAAFFSNFFTVILLGLVSISGLHTPFS